MNRHWQLWLSFAVCLTVVLAALAWTSVTVLRLERAGQQARSAAALEEDVRLALWRMDSWLSTHIAQENARQLAFYEGPFTGRGHATIRADPSSYVLLYFQVQANGDVASPQIADSTGQVGRLEEARAFLDRAALLAAAPRIEHGSDAMPDAGQLGLGGKNSALGPATQLAQSEGLPEQVRRNQVEFQQRGQGGQQIFIDTARQQSVLPAEVRAGVLKPLWIGERLLLVRRVERSMETTLQGCWLDWSALRNTLLSSVQDLLPAAQLEQVDLQAPLDPGRLLAALPVCLVPGERDTVLSASGPIQLSLIIAWSCTLLAAAAVGLLFWGVVSLSQRREAFVSAVTHELRTPLTTFRMYSEMLAGGMVADDKRQHYLDRLRVEADRLMHLVDNVLAYARVERGRGARPLQSVAVQDLLAQVSPRLHERSEAAEMRLVVRVAEPLAARHARCDTAAVEQILFNLVDNACKYAARPQGAIELSVSAEDGRVLLCVRDEGPGIGRQESRRLFHPFRKSARDAARSAPGVGLGLALSRRLARDQAGDLHLVPSSQGATFVLALPTA